MKTMKKLLFLFLMIAFTFQAQGQLSIAIKGGYTEAWEEYGDIGLPDNAPIQVFRWNASAMVYYDLNKHLSVGVEPGYVQRGAACYPGFVVWNGDTRFLLDYVELPIMFQAKLPLFKDRMELFGKVGAGASMMVRAQRETIFFDSRQPPDKIPMQIGNGTNLRRWDAGAYTGAGIGVNLGPGQVFFEADFYYGFISAEKFNQSQNRSYNLGIGYRINL